MTRAMATLLAALRYWQAATSPRTRGIDEIASQGRTLVPLGDDEIDAICEQLALGAAVLDLGGAPAHSASLTERPAERRGTGVGCIGCMAEIGQKSPLEVYVLEGDRTVRVSCLRCGAYLLGISLPADHPFLAAAHSRLKPSESLN